MASWEVSEGGDDSTHTPSWHHAVGTGKYLTARAKDFLRKKLDILDTNNWYQLGIELEIFTDEDLQHIRTQYAKHGGSPTMKLLQDYEQRMGGVDEDHLKRCLTLIRRNDILTDLQESFGDEQKNQYPLVETRGRKPAVPSQPSTPSPSSAPPSVPTSHSQLSTVSASHQDIVINGPVRLTVQSGSIVSGTLPGSQYVHSGSGSPALGNSVALLGNGAAPVKGGSPLFPVSEPRFDGALNGRNANCVCGRSASANTEVNHHVPDSSPRESFFAGANVNGSHSDARNASASDHSDHSRHVAPPVEVRRRSPMEGQATVRPNSDPVQRRMPPTHVQGPQNLRGTNSDPSFDGNQQEDEICVVHDEDGVVPRQREEESVQQRPNYFSLNSVESAQCGAMPSPRPQETCFVISTKATKDMKLFHKIHRSLRKKNLEVFSVHAALPLQRLYSQFYAANFVIVVYTRTYEAEIKSQGSLNWKFFKRIKEEYKSNGNINKRFVPVFDTQETELMPNALLHCESHVQKRAHELLTPCNSPHQSPGNYPNPHPWQQNNLSPPSPEGTTMNNRSALGGQRSQSAPHIICESHTRPTCDQPKQKEKKIYKFWKKGK